MQNVIPFERKDVVSSEDTTTRNAIALNSTNILHGKITLYLKSKEVLSSSRVIEIPVIDRGARGNILTTSTKRIVTKERIFDPEQEEALKNCRELASGLGVGLEVKDLSTQSVLTRLLDLFFKRSISGKIPSVALDGGAITSLVSVNYENGSNGAVDPRFLQTLHH